MRCFCRSLFLCKVLCRQMQQLEQFAVVQTDPEHLIRAPAGTKCSAGRCLPLTLREHLPTQHCGMFWVELQHLGRNSIRLVAGVNGVAAIRKSCLRRQRQPCEDTWPCWILACAASLVSTPLVHPSTLFETASPCDMWLEPDL